MALTIEYAKGATPLDADEAAGLIPSGISNRGQLDELEAANILEGVTWAARSKQEVLSEQFVRELHRRMFAKVWRWAGTYRASGKNIGVPAHDIAVSVRDLVEDIRMQVEANGDATEVALRFHHRLTKIHAFANGNGRHARLLTDLLLEKMGKERFEWGADELSRDGEVRETYIEALRAADASNYGPLRDFLLRGREVRK